MQEAVRRLRLDAKQQVKIGCKDCRLASFILAKNDMNVRLAWLGVAKIDCMVGETAKPQQVQFAKPHQTDASGDCCNRAKTSSTPSLAS